jgi:hypothetical protein
MALVQSNISAFTSNNAQGIISPCYAKGIWILHPMYLIYVTNQLQAFCLTKPYVDTNGVTRITQACNDEDARTISETPVGTKNSIDFNASFNTPNVTPSPKGLLALYQIYSYEDTNLWYRKSNPKSLSSFKGGNDEVETNMLPWATVRRVFEAAFRVYGKEKLGQPDDETVGVLRDVLVTYWIQKWQSRFSLSRDKLVTLFSDETLFYLLKEFHRKVVKQWENLPSPLYAFRETCEARIHE